MSDLNIAISSTGFVGVENEKSHINNVNESEKIDKVSLIEETPKEPEEATSKVLAHKEVEVALEEVNAFVQSMQRNLSFSIDEQLGQEIISITDSETQEVIRQIPSEELVVVRKKMDDVVGILFDSKV